MYVFKLALPYEVTLYLSSPQGHAAKMVEVRHGPAPPNSTLTGHLKADLPTSITFCGTPPTWSSC